MKWTLLLALFIAGCAQAPRTAPYGTRTVGHGGMGPDHELPMNSKEAVKACLATGRNGVEVDVQMTSDGVLVCYHAQDLSELTNCSGLVNAHTWAEIGSCSYSHGEHRLLVTPLDSVLRMFGRSGREVLTLDCKLFAAGDWSAFLDRFAMALSFNKTHFGRLPELNVECQVTEFLDRVKRSSLDKRVFLYATEFESGSSTALTKGYDGITISNDLISSAQIQQAQEGGLQVALFGIDAGDEGAALAKGADILQLDEP
jgi:glycerophosphoryl diester phosphodiesterase